MMTHDYLAVSALMFLEFAVWGAWMPVLALRLLGPMKLTANRPAGSMPRSPWRASSPRWPPAIWPISGSTPNGSSWAAHAIGAVLLFVAARQTKFWGMFWTMLAYSVFYTATLPLVNKVLFEHVAERSPLDWGFFLWAPVAWALVGYFLTGMRQVRKTGGDGPDALYLAAVLSVRDGAGLFHPAGDSCFQSRRFGDCGERCRDESDVGGLGMLRNTNYLIFILVQLVVSGMMQFYFLGTGQFMQDRGVSGKNVSAAMGIAQAVQAACNYLLLGLRRSMVAGSGHPRRQ